MARGPLAPPPIDPPSAERASKGCSPCSSRVGSSPSRSFRFVISPPMNAAPERLGLEGLRGQARLSAYGPLVRRGLYDVTVFVLYDVDGAGAYCVSTTDGDGGLLAREAAPKLTLVFLHVDPEPAVVDREDGTRLLVGFHARTVSPSEASQTMCLRGRSQ